MKKTYIQPETMVVRLQTEGMIATSLRINNDPEKTVDTSNGGQLTNKKNPIWGGEEEEAGNSYW